MTTEGQTWPRGMGQKCGVWAPGTGRMRLHQSRGIGQFGRVDATYSIQNAQGLGVFHRGPSRVSILKTLWQPSYRQSYQFVGGPPEQKPLQWDRRLLEFCKTYLVSLS